MQKSQIALIIVLVGVLVGNVFFWQTTYADNYSLGYEAGQTSVQTESYDQGYLAGADSGYSLGYSDGYGNGTADAPPDRYDEGYTAGVSAGKTQGYNEGYSVGNQEGFSSGYSEGYINGTKDGAGTGYNIRDPTYDEMLSFIASDQTDKNTYDEHTYNCYDFTRDVCNNAFEAGFRVGDVYVEFADCAHSLVCFDTVDKGLVFVEPQTDDVVNVAVGIHYYDLSIFQAPDFDDTILEYSIIW
jgi:hypothetical protein